MSGIDDHQFDRRVSDVNVRALSTRISGIEDRVEVLEEQGRTNSRELQANTRISKQAHDTSLEVRQAVIGDEENPGLKARVDEVYAIFATARNGFRMIGKAGDAVMKVSDSIERRPKTTWMLVIFCFGAYSLLTTGKVPEWFNALVKVLLA